MTIHLNSNNPRIIFSVLICLLIGFTSFIWGQNKPTDPKDILNASIQAIKGLKSVSYEATYEYISPGPKVHLEKGQVEVGRGGVSDPFLPGRIRIKSQGIKGEQEISFDGKTARRIEHDKKILIEGTVEKGGIKVALTPALALLDWNFIWAEPLKFESAATSAEYLGQSSVNGVLCHVIDLQYSVPGTDITGARWWFAVDDKLPRMFQKYENTSSGKFIRELRITNLKIGSDPAESKFKLELPKDYTYQSFIASASKVKLIPAGEVSPNWILRDVSGQEQKLSNYLGKVLVLMFWTSSCGYCKLAIPEVQKTYEKYKDTDVKILGVNVQEDKGVDPAVYLKGKGADYPTLINGDKTALEYGVQGVPVFYIIDRKGRVAFASSGYNPNIRIQLEEAIEQALKVNSSGIQALGKNTLRLHDALK